MTTADTELVEVHLLQLPLEIMAQSQQHSDELTREFTHVASPQTDSDRVPDRLLSLSAQLRGQYGVFTGSVMEEITQAQARGDATIDVTFRVPRSAGGGASALGVMWDEVDEFCRNGDLLTLETPPDLVTFRRWFLDQFTDQMRGGAPVPWPDYDG